jgi:ABC-type lipoprotein export system ATPase subunit
MKIDIVKTSQIELTHRVEMLGTMFDVPIEDKLSVELHGEVDLESKPWNIGLIVGPSGSGKSTILNNMFGVPEILQWNSRSVIDDFSDTISMETIANVCSSVGFSTIPAWLRPFDVLSTGEKFRVEVARRLLSNSKPILVDEFTSVVDRQVAQITCHSVQKFVRANSKQLVCASCHYDIIDWLQPDWIMEPGNPIKLHWRSLRERPPISVSISRVKYEAWELFKAYHYMSSELNRAARCFGLYVDNRIASFLGVLYRPHPRVRDIIGVSRVVTLPDFQGLGLAFTLTDTVASAYRALGKRFHNYPNHPAFVRSHQRSKDWISLKDSGDTSPRRGRSSTVAGFGGKRCAVFLYTGEVMNRDEAEKLISGE